jgi:hypothetical protein
MSVLNMLVSFPAFKHSEFPPVGKGHVEKCFHKIIPYAVCFRKKDLVLTGCAYSEIRMKKNSIVSLGGEIFV